MDEIHLDGKSKDIVSENISKLIEIFPEIYEDGYIDFNKLKAILGEYVDNSNERYDFSWPGKSDADKESRKRSLGTLRPYKKESESWDTTKNLYIEGDNLEVLKLLQSSYYGKIKMIYIDPPYNTGHDFIYPDDYQDNLENYLRISGQLSDLENSTSGVRLTTNPETHGRFHTNWINMMYPRLKLARNLLKEDGVIFISIDDNEMGNLKKICDEIFGEDNHVSNFIWRGGRRNAAKFVSKSHEYMLCYAKNLNYCNLNNISWHEQKMGIMEIYQKVNQLKKEYGFDYGRISEELKKWYKNLPNDAPSKNHSHYDWVDERGIYFASDISRGGGNGPIWEIQNPFTGEIVKPPSRGYAYSDKDSLLNDIENGLIHFNGNNVPCKKRYLKDNETQLIETVFYKDRRGSSKRLRALLGNNIFDFPKDELIIKKFISSFTNANDIVLDFFSGSATTAHSVLLLNSEEENSFRKFIMVQLPELCDEDSEAYKAGYKNICEIGKERIRRAGDKIVEESGNKDLDIGFKVLKLDSSNLEKWDPNYNNIKESLLVDNIKPDRNKEDLIYELMLKYGLDLTFPIESKENNIYSIGYGALIVCLEDSITNENTNEITNQIIEIAEKSSISRVVFKDSSFNNKDSVKTNVKEILSNHKIDKFITI